VCFYTVLCNLASLESFCELARASQSHRGMVNRVQVESYEQIISLISYMESELDLICQLQEHTHPAAFPAKLACLP
jgi:hypothetical protein